MKHPRIVVIACLLLVGIQGEANAQNKLIVTAQQGSHTAYNVSEIKSLKFNGGKLILNKMTGVPEQIDLSGIRNLKFGLSTGTRVLHEGMDNRMLIYPNPASRFINLAIQNTLSDEVQISIFDVQGRAWVQQVVKNPGNNNSIQVEVSRIPDGIYLCRVQSGNYTETRRFIKKTI